MPYSIAFILSDDADAFSSSMPSWSTLVEHQLSGIRKGFALRIFKCPTLSLPSLESLVEDGSATSQGLDPFLTHQLDDEYRATSSSGHALCDALVPQYNPSQLWLGVYEIFFLSTPAEAEWLNKPKIIESIRLLDYFPLGEIENETCWFYPTETGKYLAWENELQIESLPGFIPESPLYTRPIDFSRTDIRLLWTLMADEEQLTCVGLTYQRRRIDWQFTRVIANQFSTWSSFMVNSLTEPTYRRLSIIKTQGDLKL